MVMLNKIYHLTRGFKVHPEVVAAYHEYNAGFHQLPVKADYIEKAIAYSVFSFRSLNLNDNCDKLSTVHHNYNIDVTLADTEKGKFIVISASKPMLRIENANMAMYVETPKMDESVILECLFPLTFFEAVSKLALFNRPFSKVTVASAVTQGPVWAFVIEGDETSVHQQIIAFNEGREHLMGKELHSWAVKHTGITHKFFDTLTVPKNLGPTSIVTFSKTLLTNEHNFVAF